MGVVRTSVPSVDQDLPLSTSVERDDVPEDLPATISASLEASALRAGPYTTPSTSAERSALLKDLIATISASLEAPALRAGPYTTMWGWSDIDDLLTYPPAPRDTSLKIPVRRIDPDLALPIYSKPGDAGADLRAAETTSLKAGGGRALIRTGIAIAIPIGYAGFIQPRSGLALRHGITCLNTPGLIDSGYRDELRVLLVNTDRKKKYKVQRGDRIAQLVIQKVEAAEWDEVGQLDESERGLGGFGHTGR